MEQTHFKYFMNKKTLSALCLASLLIFPSCKEKEQQANPHAEGLREVDVITAVAENIPVKTRLPGRLEPYRQAEVRARVTGIVQKRCYEEGQALKEGDALFEIDPAPLQATLDGCEATLARADANLKDCEDKLTRYEALVLKGAVSKREHLLAGFLEAQARAERDSALAARERARLELGYAHVTSPIEGIARRALVTEGAYVTQNESTHLTTVEQINPIYIRFSQPVTELSALRRSVLAGELEGIALEDIKVELIMPDGRIYPQAGKLFFADRSVDPQTDTVEMRAEFPNPEMELLPGTYVRASFDSAIRKNIFRIPRDAVTRTSQGASVFVVNDKNIVEVRPVKTELLESKNWIITDGLKDGDRVITSKQSMLFPGTPVKIAAPVKPAAQVDEATPAVAH